MRTNGTMEMILALVTVNPKFASRQDFCGGRSRQGWATRPALAPVSG